MVDDEMMAAFNRLKSLEPFEVKPSSEATVKLAGLRPDTFTITDRRTGLKKQVEGIQFDVVEVDGKPVSLKWNVIQRRLLEHLRGLYAADRLLGRKIKLSRAGTGFEAEYSIEVLTEG